MKTQYEKSCSALLITFFSIFSLGYDVYDAFSEEQFNIAPDLESALLAEDWEKVINLLDTVNVETRSPVLRMIKGHACLATNRNDESLCLFLSFCSSEGLYKIADLVKWSKWTKEMRKRNPQQSITYYFTGDAQARLSHLDSAVVEFTNSVRLDSTCLSLNGRGVCYTALGQMSMAKQDFEDAISKNPNFADAYANLGARNIQMNDGASGALKRFNLAIDNSPGFSLALYGRGCIKMIMNNQLEAKQDINKAMTAFSCLFSSFVFAEDYKKMTAYWTGLTENELLASNEDTVGTTMDVSFKRFNTTVDNYKNNPSQFNFNRMAEAFNKLPETNQKACWTDAMNRLEGLDKMPTHLNTYQNWNKPGGWADFWTGTAKNIGRGFTAFGNPVQKLGGLAAQVGTEHMEKRWTSPNYQNACKMKDMFNSKFDTYQNNCCPPGGVDMNFNNVYWESGNWQIDPHYGLQYHIKSPS